MKPTPTQRLASNALGTDVVGWVAARRESPDAPSFQQIASELRSATGVTVTDQTIRLWYLSGQPVAS